MSDNLKPDQRRRNMQNIRGRDTKPEVVVRRLLHRRGFRFRLHVPTLPGRPDIVLPKYRTIILVHGCFWHRHGCRWTTTPATREDFWKAKFTSNVNRDRVVRELLEEAAWQVIVVWECETRPDGRDGLEKRLCGMFVRDPHRGQTEQGRVRS